MRVSTSIALVLVLAAVAKFSVAAGGELKLRIVDLAGRGVANAVVTLTLQKPRSSVLVTGSMPSAVMDQRNKAFDPEVLVVGVGTLVDFPNSDIVSHQVYSFSTAKRFQLPLYKGSQHPGVRFDRAGLVVLGCNIHDSMVGYIFVTDASYFGSTDATGSVDLSNIMTGDYQMKVWGPLIADSPESLTQTLAISNAGITIEITLKKGLRTRSEPRPRSGASEY